MRGYSAYQRAVYAERDAERAARRENAEAAVEAHLHRTGELDLQAKVDAGYYAEDEHES